MPRHFKDPEENLDRMREERAHGKRDQRDRDDRPSWREIDRRRAQSSHTEQGRDPRSQEQAARDRYHSAQAQKALKGQLDELFRDKTGDALRDAVIQAQGKSAVQQALDAYLEAKGELPPDPELLEKALEARKDATVRQALDVIEQVLPEAEASQRKVLLLKMRSLARRTFDAKAARKMKALLNQHDIVD